MAAALTALAPHAHAQNTFNRVQNGGAIIFSYGYPTPAGGQQQLQFRLNLDDIQRGSAEFQQWNDTEARALGQKDAQLAADTFKSPTLNVQVQVVGNEVVTSYRGLGRLPDKTQQDTIEKAITDAFDVGQKAYASNHMYSISHKVPGENIVEPDYIKITKRYTAAMGPVAQAILQQIPATQSNPRIFINTALNWLQNIPYDTLQNRATSNGAGFQTPYGLLLGNRGDCDTKTVALAALLHAAYPTLPLAIILVPNHAFLGIGLPQTSQDFALRTEYGSYILAEPTGPALTPLGYIEPSTQTRIGANETAVLPIR